MKGDFLGFSFNGVHSDDMGIVRMSDGSRYSTDLTPEIEDRTNSVPGRDGVYFYGSDFKDGKISVKVAFDQLTDRQFRALRKWLGVKEPAPLIFDEFPFKKYMAKLASAPVFDYVCFDERRRWPSETAQDGVRVVDRTTVTEDVPYTEDLTVENGSSVIISRKPETVTVTYESEQLTAEDFDYVSETGELSIHITDVESGDAINVTVDYTIEESTIEIEREQVYPYEYADDVERIYKGEGTIDFEVPFPYAIGTGVTVEDIREDASVPEQWEGASYLPTAAEYVEYGINQYDDGVIPVYNCGDVPTGFKLTLEPGSSSGSEGRTTGNPITVNDAAGGVDSLTVDLEPVQDLHGYDKPWAAGAGKNKFEPLEGTADGVTWESLSDGTSKITGTVITTSWVFLEEVHDLPWRGITAGNKVAVYADNARLSLQYAVGEGAWTTLANASGNAAIVLLPAEATKIRLLQYPENQVSTSGTVFNKIAKYYLAQSETFTSWTPYSNICPITGHDSVTVGVTGKNMLDPSKRKNSIINIWWGATLANDVPDGSFVLNAGTYTLSASDTMTGLYIVNTSRESIAVIYNATSLTFTLTKRTVVKVVLFKQDVTLDYMESVNVQLEVGSTASAYESYYGHSTTVTLPSTVYGGTVGVTSGTGTSTMANIASYNGETINEPWLSSIDEYSPGATPTTGAQVVYTLATPATLTTTPTDITLYNGDNVVSSDGDMDLTYVKTTTGGITYKNKSLNIDFSIMPFEENDDSAVVVDTFNRVIRGVDSGVLYNKCIVGGDFFLLDPSTDIGDTDEQISLALENSQFSSITYDYLFY